MGRPEVRTSGDISAAAAEGGDSSVTTTASVSDAQPSVSTSQDSDQVAAVCRYTDYG